VIMRIVVDFPDPLGPRKPVTAPGRTSKPSPSTDRSLWVPAPSGPTNTGLPVRDGTSPAAMSVPTGPT